MKRTLLITTCLCLLFQIGAFSQGRTIDLVDEFNLYPTNKIVISFFSNTQEERRSIKITDLKEIAEIMRSLESAEYFGGGFMPSLSLPLCQIEFLRNDDSLAILQYSTDNNTLKRFFGGFRCYKASPDFINILDRYIE